MKKQHEDHAVVGVFRDRFAADACFIALIRRGYLSSDINIMMTDRTRTRDYAWSHEDPDLATTEFELDVMGSEGGGSGTSVATSPPRTVGMTVGSKVAQGVGVGGGIGTAVGATLAAIAAVGTTLAIPGLNLIVAGPILAHRRSSRGEFCAIIGIFQHRLLVQKRCHKLQQMIGRTVV